MLGVTDVNIFFVNSSLMHTTVHCARTVLDDCHTLQKAYVGGQLDAHEYLCQNLDGMYGYGTGQRLKLNTMIRGSVFRIH